MSHSVPPTGRRAPASIRSTRRRAALAVDRAGDARPDASRRSPWCSTTTGADARWSSSTAPTRPTRWSRSSNACATRSPSDGSGGAGRRLRATVARSRRPVTPIAGSRPATSPSGRRRPARVVRHRDDAGPPAAWCPRDLLAEPPEVDVRDQPLRARRLCRRQAQPGGTQPASSSRLSTSTAPAATTTGPALLGDVVVVALEAAPGDAEAAANACSSSSDASLTRWHQRWPRHHHSGSSISTATAAVCRRTSSARGRRARLRGGERRGRAAGGVGRGRRAGPAPDGARRGGRSPPPGPPSLPRRPPRHVGAAPRPRAGGRELGCAGPSTAAVRPPRSSTTPSTTRRRATTRSAARSSPTGVLVEWAGRADRTRCAVGPAGHATGAPRPLTPGDRARRARRRRPRRARQRPASYQAYVTGVRAEYGHLDERVALGRGDVLRGLLGRAPLFATAPAGARWEARAGANMAAELATLV